MSFGFFPPELVANVSAEFLPLSLFPRLCQKRGCPLLPLLSLQPLCGWGGIWGSVSSEDPVGGHPL